MNTFEQIEASELSLTPFAAINDGWMLVTGVKPDGKRSMAAREFVAGLRGEDLTWEEIQ